MPNITFAWCFDHGYMHMFEADTEPWCTARWVGFPADSEKEALTAKREAYGDAVFFDQLTLEQKIDVMGADA